MAMNRLPAGQRPEVITRADLEASLGEVAWDYYIKGTWIQYDSRDLNTREDGTNAPMSRWMGGFSRLDNHLATLEDANSHDSLYTVCSNFVWSVYHEALGWPLFGNPLNASSISVWRYCEKPEDMLLVRWHNWEEGVLKDPGDEGWVSHGKCVSFDELKCFIANWDKNLRPGDIVYVPGHVVLYAGNGWILEGAGLKYNMKNGTDVVECSGSIRAWTVEDYFLSRCSGSSYYLENYLPQDNARICIVRPLDLLTVASGSDPGNDILNEGYVQTKVPRMHWQPAFDTVELPIGGYTIRDATYTRLDYPAMNIDRTVNITPYGTAVKGGTLTYTVVISNESSSEKYRAFRAYGSDAGYAGEDYRGLCIAETVPENTELICAPGAAVSGNQLRWKVDVPAGGSVKVAYTVRVTGGIGQRIVSGGGWVGNIPSNTIINTIGGRKLSRASLKNMQKFYEAGKTAWNSNDGFRISAATCQGTRFARRIYQELAGLDLELPDIQALVDTLFTQTRVTAEGGACTQYDDCAVRYMYILNPAAPDPGHPNCRDMVIDGYFGGIWAYSNSYDPAVRRLNEPRLDYLEPGDILIYMDLTEPESGGKAPKDRRVVEWKILVYLAEGRFASLTSEGRLYAIEGSKGVMPCFTFDLFVGLRPSQVYENINENLPVYTGPAAKLTEKDAAWKYTRKISKVSLNDELCGKLAALTPNDVSKVNGAMIGEVYSRIGLDIVTDGTKDAAFIDLMERVFDDLPSGSEAYAVYRHEYHLPDEPTSGHEALYEMLLYYDGRAFADVHGDGTRNDPITSMEQLRVGDAILLGLRQERHYVCLVYQGDGRFLAGIHSLVTGVFYYGKEVSAMTFADDAAFLNYLYGTIESRNPPVTDGYFWEGYVVLRPARAFDDINAVLL